VAGTTQNCSKASNRRDGAHLIAGGKSTLHELLGAHGCSTTTTVAIEQRDVRKVYPFFSTVVFICLLKVPTRTPNKLLGL